MFHSRELNGRIDRLHKFDSIHVDSISEQPQTSTSEYQSFSELLELDNAVTNTLAGTWCSRVIL